MKTSNNKYKAVWFVGALTLVGALWIGYSVNTQKKSQVKNKAEALLSQIKNSVMESPGGKVDFLFSESNNKEKLEELQTQYKEILNEFDLLEAEYSISNAKYLELLKNNEDNLASPEIKNAFNESQEILNKMAVQSQRISKLSVLLQGEYMANLRDEGEL